MTTGQARIWINDSSGDFSVTGQVIQCGNVKAMRVDDRNEDTYMDLVFFYENQGETVYINDCAGQFTEQPTPTPTPENTVTPTPTTP